MIKKIIFQADFEGQGIVNFDGDEQRNFLNEHCGTKYFNNNYKLGKKVFTKKENASEEPSFIDKNGKEYFNNTDYLLKISSTCLRNAIFANDANVTNPAATKPEECNVLDLTKDNIIRMSNFKIPGIKLSLSKTNTVLLFLKAYSAEVIPAAPAPITIKSYISFCSLYIF